MRTARLGIALLLAVVGTSAGCKQLASIAYYAGPRRIQPAEFKLGEGRLAVVIETVYPEQDNPVFNQALFDKLVEIFRENKVKGEVVPLRELLELRQRHADFSRWSLQRIGRELKAEQVLYLRLEELRLRETPDHPLVSPKVSVRIKVVGVQAPSVHARLWPEETEGRTIICERQPQEASDPQVIDSEALKLARDTAYLVAQPFHDVDLEEPTPKER